MERSDEWLSPSTVIAFVVAFAVLGTLLYLVGPGDVLVALAVADPAILVLVLIVVMMWMSAWSGSFHLIASAFEVDLDVADAGLVYVHMMFLDNVVPFSSISADPFAALAVSRTSGADYERSLATVVTVDFLNFLPAPAFGTVGAVYLLTTGAFPQTIASVTISLTALLIGLSTVGYIGWRFRRRIRRYASMGVVKASTLAGSIVPRLSPPSKDQVDRRLESLITDLEQMADDRRSLLVVLGLATTGWALLATTFWLSMYSMGVVVPVRLALFLVALVTVVELFPLPGGIGGAESLFVVFLVALTDTSAATATAGVLVHRGATFWFPVLLGGGVVPVLLRD